MLLTLTNVLYVLIALAMIILILLQRGAGATAGSGFGAGASATVFGARGSANFLSKSTAILATLFFILSLGMAVYASRSMQTASPDSGDLGIMGAVPSEVPAATDAPAAPAATEVPAATSGDVPAAAPAATATEAPADAAAAPAATAVEVEKPAETAEKQEEKSE